MASKKTERRKRQKAGKEKILPRGGQPGIKLTERHKEKLSASAILNRLTKHALDEDGETQMSPTQIQAAQIVLKKLVPDLSAVHQTDAKEESHEEWVKKFNARRNQGITGD